MLALGGLLGIFVTSTGGNMNSCLCDFHKSLRGNDIWVYYACMKLGLNVRTVLVAIYGDADPTLQSDFSLRKGEKPLPVWTPIKMLNTLPVAHGQFCTVCSLL